MYNYIIFVPMLPLRNAWVNWAIFIILSLIWGSSFILMKLGMYDEAGNTVLTPFQVAALRLLSGGLVLVPFAIRSFRAIPRDRWRFVILSGLLGSFLPAFLFCVAETRIDSALAGALNSLTPIFVIITGFLLYRAHTSRQKTIGVLVALTGCFLLLVTKDRKANDNAWYAVFVLIATIFYGINVNMVRRRLQDINSLHIAAAAFVSFTIPSLLVLLATGYFHLPLGRYMYIKATLASTMLGIGGTAIATILFYTLIKRAGALFGSMVTYGIPFVAIGWGLIFGEHITFLQVISLAVILSGVFIANK